jgi:arylformamidase
MLESMWDITRPVDEAMPAWPGTPPPRQRWLERMRDGQLADVSEWTLNAHAGTHLDAPSHFIADAPDLEALGLDALVGPCTVLAYQALGGSAADRILVKLQHGGGLTLEDAQRLVCGGTRVVGVDALSVETAASVDDGAPVHKLLLANGIVILEDLDLTNVPDGEYTLIALPLRLQHAEASPIRAILLPRAFRRFSGAHGQSSGDLP